MLQLACFVSSLLFSPLQVGGWVTDGEVSHRTGGCGQKYSSKRVGCHRLIKSGDMPGIRSSLRGRATCQWPLTCAIWLDAQCTKLLCVVGCPHTNMGSAGDMKAGHGEFDRPSTPPGDASTFYGGCGGGGGYLHGHYLFYWKVAVWCIWEQRSQCQFAVIRLFFFLVIVYLRSEARGRSSLASWAPVYPSLRPWLWHTEDHNLLHQA